MLDPSMGDDYKRLFKPYVAVILIVAMVVLYVYAVYIVTEVTVDAVCTSQILSALTMDLIGMTVVLLVLIMCVVDNPMDSKLWFGFIALLSLAYLSLFWDSFSWIAVLDPRYGLINVVATFFTCINIAVAPYMFWAFLYLQMQDRDYRYRHLDYFNTMIFIVNVVLSLLNVQFGFLYTFDPVTYEYSRSNTFFLGSIIPTILCLTTIYLIVHSDFSFVKKAAMLMYPVLQIIGTLIVLQIELPFYLITTVWSLLIIYGNIYVEMEKKKKKRESILLGMRAATTVSQMQPHFTYNVLTAIMNIPGTPQETKDAIVDFSHYLRSNVDTVDDLREIHFSKELDHIETYLNLERLRFRDKIKVEYDIQCDDFFVPAMSIQVYVENAVKHGILKLERPGTLKITSRDMENKYVVFIEDDGVGFDPKKPLSTSRGHVGISNSKGRISEIFGGTVDVFSLEGVGTMITISFPKERMQAYMRTVAEKKRY